MPKTLTTLGLRLRGARFAILREQGRTRLAFGSAAPAFVRACGELLAAARIDDAWVAQTGRAGRARLLFSAEVPDDLRQRIRNVWTPPPGSGAPGARGAG